MSKEKNYILNEIGDLGLGKYETEFPINEEEETTNNENDKEE